MKSTLIFLPADRQNAQGVPQTVAHLMQQQFIFIFGLRKCAAQRETFSEKVFTQDKSTPMKNFFGILEASQRISNCTNNFKFNGKVLMQYLNVSAYMD